MSYESSKSRGSGSQFEGNTFLQNIEQKIQQKKQIYASRTLKTPTPASFSNNQFLSNLQEMINRKKRENEKNSLPTPDTKVDTPPSPFAAKAIKSLRSIPKKSNPSQRFFKEKFKEGKYYGKEFVSE